MSNYGWFIDGGIVVFLLLHSFLGWRRGLLWQAAGIASLGLGVGLGLLLAPIVGARVMSVFTNDPFHAKLAGFLLVFGLIGFTLRLVASYIEVRAERGLAKNQRDERRAKDRMLGGIFGAVKGLALAAILVAACVTFFPKSALWNQSHLASSLATAGSRLLPDGAVKEVRAWAKQHVANIE